MIGAIIGDIVGSKYEFKNFKKKEFEMFEEGSSATDDTVMTLAVAESILEADGDVEKLENIAVHNLKLFGRKYPYAGYGGRFNDWIVSDTLEPYNSLGNGAAMRISPVGYAANSLEEVCLMSDAVTKVTHNHPSAMNAARAVASCIFLARQGKSKDEIRAFVRAHYYPLDRTVDEIRPTYRFFVDCDNSVPEAIECFLEGEDFEDTLRNAVSLGGDSDTQAAIAGSIAEAYFKVPILLRGKAIMFLDEDSLDIVRRFENKYGNYTII